MEFQTLGEFFSYQCEIYEARTALQFRKWDGETSRLDYGRLGRLSHLLARGLRKKGLKAGDRCCMVGENTPAWVIAFMAIHLCEGVDVSMDIALGREKLDFILKHTGATFCFVDNESLAKELGEKHPGLSVVVLNWKKKPGLGPRVFSLASLSIRGPAAKIRENVAKHMRYRLKDDPASILYLKATLDRKRPRAAVLTHRNILSNIRALSRVIPATELDSVISCLPFWHSSGRLSLLYSLWNGAGLGISNPSTFFSDMEEFEPTLAMAFPAVFERFRKTTAEGRPGETRSLILFRWIYLHIARRTTWAIGVYSGQLPDFKKPHPSMRILEYMLALLTLVLLIPFKLMGDLVYGGGIRKSFGRRLRAIFTGGGSLHRKTDFFFQGLGLSVLESYWMSEATHVLSCRVLEFTGQRDRLVPGTVGPLLPGTELKLINTRGEDITHLPGVSGGIFVRGEQVMQGYFKDPEATANVLDDNGWLRTGDTGRLTLTGELQITGSWGRR